MATIVVHGGAAPIALRDVAGHEAVCRRAVERGLSVLASGGSALDAVVEAVVVLEDDPVTNAGTGAVLNRDGIAELDALAMEGTRLGLGAVAGIRDVRNPIRVARALVDEPTLNMLLGDGASRWAHHRGIPRIDPSALVTPESRRSWLERPRRSEQPADTVGAVAADDRGQVAAAVSTGGIFDKPPGRVGDAPLVGSGGYADDSIGAAVATGVGEAIMRVLLARTALERLASGLDPMAAAAAAIELLGARVQGQGGIIVVDPAGRPGWAFNTTHMSWGVGDTADGKIRVGH